MTHALPRILLLAALAIVAVACGGDAATTASATDPAADEPASAAAASDQTADEPADEPTAEDTSPVTDTMTSSFTAEVWADNWFALYVNGALVGEDSVPITTERSFNAETITFEAAYPLTVAVEAKDYRETDSGLEYIGQPNQQMGDGGVILQITDNTTGEVVAVTSADWQTMVIHQAPLNPGCERDSDPDATCESAIQDAPDGWTAVDFDDSAWAAATVWSEADVSPKDGYDQIAWDASAQLVWGTDLEIDNTVLLRTTVTAAP